MERGYVNLWRCSLDSRVFGNDGLWKVWTWCLMKASHQNRWVPIITGKGKTEIEIQSGQFIFGRKTAAKELLMTESTIRNRIEKLKSIGNISLKPDTHYTIITICNWERYQSNEKPKGQAKDNQRTTKGQPKDTDKNVKNVKNETIRAEEHEEQAQSILNGKAFSTFWEEYPKKRDKAKAEKAWLKIKPSEDLASKIIKAVSAQKKMKSWQKDDGQFIPLPTTWLNGRRWEDEINEQEVSEWQ